MSDASTIAAWWGAVIATSVLAWDVYKWKRRGPKLVIRVQGDMRILYDGDDDPCPDTWLMFTGANLGDGPTTLENLGLLYYRNLWSRIRRKPDKSYWIRDPGIRDQFPCKLDPGETWNGRGKQPAELTEQANEGYVTCCLYHSSSTKPATCRVRLKPEEAPIPKVSREN